VYAESGYNVVWVSMRIVLRIGPPSYTILVRSCVSLCCAVLSLVIYLYDIIRMHGTINIKIMPVVFLWVRNLVADIESGM